MIAFLGYKLQTRAVFFKLSTREEPSANVYIAQRTGTLCVDIIVCPNYFVNQMGETSRFMSNHKSHKIIYFIQESLITI